MVELARLRALLDRTREETDHLRRLATTPRAELLANPDLLAAAKYRFVVAIEACIDAGEHVIASEGLRAPTDFADVFASLAESERLPADLVPNLQRMARFQNLLVHGYARVDDGQVIDVLTSRLGDLDAFRAAIAASSA
jgi:uncharacterized protein YutE (UPF0331/DUF86 family)